MEKQLTERQMSDSIHVGVLLAFVGGFLDIYTYISRDGVFANAQTGNMVLLGMYIARGDWNRAVKYLIPVLSFVVGVMVVEYIKVLFKQNPELNNRIHWRQIIIGIEAFVLCGVAYIPNGSMNVVANILISFVCSMQVQSFRKFEGNAYATTMCTGNLRSATEHLCVYARTKDPVSKIKAIRYFLIIGIFILGAVFGYLATTVLEIKAVCLPIVILVIVLGMMFRERI